MYSGHDNAMCTQIDGNWWYKAYTDGSNQNGTSRELARAGWGVFYAKGSQHNKASKLHGPVQTSYRAELRALLHVVRTASCRILVMCDCKSVVNTFQAYQMHGRRKCGALQEEDLWIQIFDIMD
jgi:ribonuclease HI